MSSNLLHDCKLVGTALTDRKSITASFCGPVRAQSSPCSYHCIFTAGDDAAARGREGWSLAGGWKKQARMLLQITNVNSNTKQESAPM